MSRSGTMVAALALTLLPSVARAQQNHLPPVEVASGYANLRNAEVDESFSAGMFVSVEGNYRRWLTVVGEFSGTFATGSPRFFGDPDAGTGAFLTGPKVTYRGVPRLVPFGQLLVGVGSSGDTRDGSPAVGVQPGAGLDVVVHDHVALRLAADRRQLLGIRNASGASTSLTVFRAGLVVY